MSGLEEEQESGLSSTSWLIKQTMDLSRRGPSHHSAKSHSRLALDCGWSCIPHPLKVARGGEDVHIVARAGGNTLIGVFDGVGGWAELGVDPAEYARRLASILERELRANPSISMTQEKPLVTMLETAFHELEATELPGSCTVCLALLNPKGQLHVLNVGDSGLYVIRDEETFFQTNEQQHYFNCPFQLGMGSDDTPADADYYVLDSIDDGDYIVVATDGVWDNLFEQDMLSIIGRHSDGDNCEAMAREISEVSHLHGRDQQYLSPFAANAQREGLRYFGGKLDDVTVVVAKICTFEGLVDELDTSPVSSMESSDSLHDL